MPPGVGHRPRRAAPRGSQPPDSTFASRDVQPGNGGSLVGGAQVSESRPHHPELPLGARADREEELGGSGGAGGGGQDADLVAGQGEAAPHLLLAAVWRAKEGPSGGHQSSHLHPEIFSTIRGMPETSSESYRCPQTSRALPDLRTPPKISSSLQGHSVPQSSPVLPEFLVHPENSQCSRNPQSLGEP